MWNGADVIDIGKDQEQMELKSQTMEEEEIR